jgi:Bacterial Ig-like domain (group 3)
MADEVKEDLNDALGFPILTEEVRFPVTTTRPGTSGAPGTSRYGQIVESTLRDILGWRVRDNDPKGFVAALNQSFDVNIVQGHTEWKWTPHTYAIEADMGAVTGAQAAIYSRAKAALNQALPLLDGLQTLLAISDEQEVEAYTAIVRSSLTELVNELGVEGGPRVTRVDDYFLQLLGPHPDLRDSEKVGGQLGLLRNALGLIRQNVNTIDEEQNLTNFLILVDYVVSLRATWNAQKHFFDREGRDVFLGTQLVLLSRTLANLAESVQETYFILDSVFIGPAERQVTELTLDGNRVFLGELLDWVEHFALEEGPRLIREGGKDGVINAFAPTAKRLRDLTDAAAKEASQLSGNPTRGFHTFRVHRALGELTTDLNEIMKLADQVKRQPGPSVTFVDPEQGNSGDIVRLTINGANFEEGAEVRLNVTGNRDVKLFASKVVFVDEAELKATFDLDPKTATPGSTWTVVVINPDKQVGRLKGAFSVNNKADTSTTVTSSQNPSELGKSVTFTATVSANPPGAVTPTGTVAFNEGGSLIGTGTLSGGVATFTTSALAVGGHTITTDYSGDTNHNTSMGSLIGNPQVVNPQRTPLAQPAPSATISKSTPKSVIRRPGQKVTITGKNLDPQSARVHLRAGAVRIDGTIDKTSSSDTKLVAMFDLSPLAAASQITEVEVGVQHPGEPIVTAPETLKMR